MKEQKKKTKVKNFELTSDEKKLLESYMKDCHYLRFWANMAHLQKKVSVNDLLRMSEGAKTLGGYIEKILERLQ